MPHPAVDRVWVFEEGGVGEQVRFGLTEKHGLVLLFQGKMKRAGFAT